MNDYPVTRGARPGDPHLRLRLAALIAVIAGVVLVAAAAFLLSYAGIHQIALQAGVSSTLARLYPLMFDAMLVVTCAAVLALRSAGWGTKLYVWACLLVVLAAVAVGDAMHATGVQLTGQAARAAIAVIPWVLLLMGFGIWLVMLRQWRRARAAAAFSETESSNETESSPAGRERPAIEAPTAAAGAVSWAVVRGAAVDRPDAPAVGIDTLLQRDADRAPDRIAAREETAEETQAPAQDEQQRTAEPAPNGPAAATAGVAGAEALAARPNGAGATEVTGTSPESDHKDNGDARGRRTRLGGLLKLPDNTPDEEESFKGLPAEPKAAEGADSGTDSQANGAGAQAGDTVQAEDTARAEDTTRDEDTAHEGDTAYDGLAPAPLPAAALAPHFDRLRSSPTPPGETGISEE
jgi:Protein of unknown function (DUF2637)